MKLLFNIQDKEISSDEIKEHLGYVDADLSFKNLMPDIITSTNDIKKLIGKEVYDLVHQHYTQGLNAGVYEYDYEDYNDLILRATRYPILVKAYSLFEIDDIPCDSSLKPNSTDNLACSIEKLSSSSNVLKSSFP